MSNESNNGIPERPKDYWFFRRRTMFVCIALMIIVAAILGCVAWFNPKAVESMSVVIGWLYSGLSIPIFGYYGNCAVQEFAKNRKM